jgi:hypothetical protein
VLGCVLQGVAHEDDVCYGARTIEEGIYHYGTSVYIMGYYADGFY